MPGKGKKKVVQEGKKNQVEVAEDGGEADAALCERLDELLLQFVFAMQEWTDMYQNLSENLKSAHFDLGRARIATGPRGITSTQYDKNMTATLRVLDSESQEGLFEAIRTCCRSAVVGSVEDEEPTTELRQRRPKKSEKKRIEEAEGEDDGSSLKDSGSIKKAVTKDPIFWFGYLPPQTLRSSQRHFTSAVHLTIELANVKRRLLSIEKEYATLFLQKNEKNT